MLSSDEQSCDGCDNDNDEQILARKIKQMLLRKSEMQSDPDDELVKRKIRERLEEPPSPGRVFMERTSNADMFDDSDDASSESTQPERTLIAAVTKSDRDSSSSASEHSSRESQRSDRQNTRSVRKNEEMRAAEKVYSELQEIHLTLQSESAVLKDREKELIEREKKLRQAEEMYNEVLEQDKRQSLKELESAYQRDLDELNELYGEKCRENKRLRENFDTIKATNDTLKGQLETLTSRHEKLERQSASLQARFTNLHRLHTSNENKTPTPQNKQMVDKDSFVETKPKPKTKPAVGTVEVLSVLLEWLAETQLHHVTRMAISGTKPENDDQSMERAVKILPYLCDLLREGVTQGGRMDLPCLQFIYWSLYRLDRIQGIHRTSLSSTLRRLGEEFYRNKKTLTFDSDPANTDFTDKIRGVRDGRFFRSSDLQERFLSSMIILRTLTQADIVAHVFDSVKIDLKENVCKEMFLLYRALNVLLNFFKPANQTLLSGTCDILLQLCMESRVLDEFLKVCSTETWFRQCAVILKSPAVERKIVEKLSVVLQKLSKIRTNRRLLDMYGITSAVQDLLRDCHDQNAFLALNLKSIQYNLLNKYS